MFADCHSRWRNYFLKLLNVHGDNDLTQTEIHTVEPLAPKTRAFVVETPVENLKRHKGIDHIPAEMIKAGGRIICTEIYKLINSILNKEELPEQWKESITVPIYKLGNETDCSNYRGISLCQLHTKFYPPSFCQC
jgi:hypothetical protein